MVSKNNILSAHFEKVSYTQFKKDCDNLGVSLAESQIQYAYDHIKLPCRATTGSAGYDFYSPFDFVVNNAPVLIPTGIRVSLPREYFLNIVPRSGLGFKTGVSLANTTGIIDSDYFYSDNEGHIMIKFVPGFKELTITQGDRIAQGILLRYFVVLDDQAKADRNGGFGSTGTK